METDHAEQLGEKVACMSVDGKEEDSKMEGDGAEKKSPVLFTMDYVQVQGLRSTYTLIHDPGMLHQLCNLETDSPIWLMIKHLVDPTLLHDFLDSATQDDAAREELKTMIAETVTARPTKRKDGKEVIYGLRHELVQAIHLFLQYVYRKQNIEDLSDVGKDLVISTRETRRLIGTHFSVDTMDRDTFKQFVSSFLHTPNGVDVILEAFDTNPHVTRSIFTELSRASLGGSMYLSEVEYTRRRELQETAPSPSTSDVAKEGEASPQTMTVESKGKEEVEEKTASSSDATINQELQEMKESIHCLDDNQSKAYLNELESKLLLKLFAKLQDVYYDEAKGSPGEEGVKKVIGMAIEMGYHMEASLSNQNKGQLHLPSKDRVILLLNLLVQSLLVSLTLYDTKKGRRPDGPCVPLDLISACLRVATSKFNPEKEG